MFIIFFNIHNFVFFVSFGLVRCFLLHFATFKTHHFHYSSHSLENSSHYLVIIFISIESCNGGVKTFLIYENIKSLIHHYLWRINVLLAFFLYFLFLFFLVCSFNIFFRPNLVFHFPLFLFADLYAFLTSLRSSSFNPGKRIIFLHKIIT